MSVKYCLPLPVLVRFPCDNWTSCLLSKIPSRYWSYPRHVMCINNQCCSMQQHPGEHDSCSRGTWREVHLAMHLHLIFGPNAILRRSNIYSALHDLVSIDATVISSLKRCKKSFSFCLLYTLNNNSCWQKLEYMFFVKLTVGHLIIWIKSGVNSGVNSGVISGVNARLNT